MFLEVDENNSPAIRLYRRAGFREVGRRPNYYPGPGGKPAAALVCGAIWFKTCDDTWRREYDMKADVTDAGTENA